MDETYTGCFEMLNVVNNYLWKIGSELHHLMKHGRACTPSLLGKQKDFTGGVLLGTG